MNRWWLHISSLCPNSSPYSSSGKYFQRLFPDGNLMFWLHNQWLSSWGRAMAQRRRAGLASFFLCFPCFQSLHDPCSAVPRRLLSQTWNLVKSQSNLESQVCYSSRRGKMMALKKGKMISLTCFKFQVSCSSCWQQAACFMIKCYHLAILT